MNTNWILNIFYTGLYGFKIFLLKEESDILSNLPPKEQQSFIKSIYDLKTKKRKDELK